MVKLVPPDETQCQAERRNSFMRMGSPEIERCNNKPKWVVTEAKPGDDGKRGSMSLCETCYNHMVQQLGSDHIFKVRVGKKPLTPRMERIVLYMRENGGCLKKYRGGRWAAPSLNFDLNGPRSRYFDTQAIRALLLRGTIYSVDIEQNRVRLR